MNQLQAMQVFVRVVDLDSFNLAAKQLGLSAASVTRSISMLEAHLNVRLLNRSTRSLSLTEAGNRYLRGCRSILEKVEQVESELVETTRDPGGVLRLAAPGTFAAGDLGTLLASYKALHPRITFDVTVFDNTIDVAEGGFDVCFSDDPRHASSTMISRRLSAVKEILVASPNYLSKRGLPKDPTELSQHEILMVAEGASSFWHFSDNYGQYRVKINSTLHSTSHTMVRTAAVNHMGIAYLPSSLVENDLSSGSLMPILSQFEITEARKYISLLYSGRSQLSLKVRSFIDFAVAQYNSPKALETLPLRAVA